MRRWFGAVVVALALMFLAAPLAQAEPLPQTTTVEQAQQDPIWAELGYSQTGTAIQDPWLLHSYWDVPHAYATQGSIEPVWADSTSQSLPVRFKHMDGGIEISSIHLSIDTARPGQLVIDAFLPGNSTAPGRVFTALSQAFNVDPLGWLAGKIADGATSLLGTVASWAVDSTSPDLTSAWWLSTYKKGFAIGTILFGFVLAMRLRRLGSQRGGDEVVSLGWWTVAYFTGVVLGPPVGQMLIDGAGYLVNGIIAQWGGTGPGQAFPALAALVRLYAGGGEIGGIVLAVFVLLPLTLFASLAIFISLALQMAILYLSSALFAIAFVWVISERYRHGSFKIPLLFAGLCASKPLMFLLLGMVFDIAATQLTVNADPGGRNLATMVMAIVVLLLAAFSPALLVKFGPVHPAGSEAAAGTAKGLMAGGGGGGSGGGGRGLSQTAMLGMQRARTGGAAGVVGGAASTAGAAANKARGTGERMANAAGGDSAWQ